MIVSGGSDGLIALSSPTTGMTVRVLNDHGGAPITCINVAHLQVNTSCYQDYKWILTPRAPIPTTHK